MKFCIIILAIKLDGVNVMGYTAWSLMDNFEWENGFVERFGIHYIDFESEDKPRVQKASARYIAQIIADNGFPEPTEPPADSSVTLCPSIIMLLCAQLLHVWFNH